ncbi:hypothetical protein [Sphingobium ummariense]|uniref:Uncharacterized protein n=1 Tax=Sphingobium ummariense RL-3 TaxID=1346791 RepID=T0K3H1_9SPHN|nr:hypothetical protein [Sphingobium ummariense]EQB31124.1 hypothetical protein M529_16380 [Sphingobium ummariense RL-3]
MLNIATPRLSPAEWQDVKATLNAVADIRCGTRPAEQLPERYRPVRAFLCETGRTRRIAEAHVPDLAEQGFSRAQIEALALLGA